MTRHLLLVLLGSTLLISSFSCKKENSGTNLFYGYWKASYGDTITIGVLGGNRLTGRRMNGLMAFAGLVLAIGIIPLTSTQAAPDAAAERF